MVSVGYFVVKNKGVFYLDIRVEKTILFTGSEKEVLEYLRDILLIKDPGINKLYEISPWIDEVSKYAVYFGAVDKNKLESLDNIQINKSDMFDLDKVKIASNIRRTIGDVDMKTDKLRLYRIRQNGTKMAFDFQIPSPIFLLSVVDEVKSISNIDNSTGQMIIEAYKKRENLYQERKFRLICMK